MRCEEELVPSLSELPIGPFENQDVLREVVGQRAVALGLASQMEAALLHKRDPVAWFLFVQMAEAALSGACCGKEDAVAAIRQGREQSGRSADGCARRLRNTRRDRIFPQDRAAVQVVLPDVVAMTRLRRSPRSEPSRPRTAISFAHEIVEADPCSAADVED